MKKILPALIALLMFACTVPAHAPAHHKSFIVSTCATRVEMAAPHFDEILLDNHCFFDRKTDHDMNAKGNRSWTHYRLDTMRGVDATGTPAWVHLLFFSIL
jgi:hypothetical protein